jgi:hypothetical protein
MLVPSLTPIALAEDRTVFNPARPLLFNAAAAAAIPVVAAVPLLLLLLLLGAEGLLGLLLLLEYRLLRWLAIIGIETPDGVMVDAVVVPQTRGASAIRRRENISSEWVSECKGFLGCCSQGGGRRGYLGVSRDCVGVSWWRADDGLRLDVQVWLALPRQLILTQRCSA